MTEDLKTIALSAIQALKQEQDKVAQLQNTLSKIASVRPDTALIQQAVSGLCKVGALAENEAQQARELFAKDPNAALRCIQALVTASAITKSAASGTDDQLFDIGTLVSVSADKVRHPVAKQDGRQTVAKILRHGI